MKFRLLLVAVSAIACAITVMPAANAATVTPSDCTGISTVSGGYRLDQDVTCTFSWAGDNEVLDLNGFTVTGAFVPRGEGQSVRNGKIASAAMSWSLADSFTASNVSFTHLESTGSQSFYIEAGHNLTVEGSTFTGIPGVALDFYLYSVGTVQDSQFVNCETAISIQRSNQVLIERNGFIGNQVGVRLYNENFSGVNDITVRQNTFERNINAGISLLPKSYGETTDFARNRFEQNQFVNNGGSGLSISATCLASSGTTSCPAGADNLIQGNVFNDNGYSPVIAGSSIDDGITARATFSGVVMPTMLASFTVTGNSAAGNADLGFDVFGVTDGGGNLSSRNGNSAQCAGLDCQLSAGGTGVVTRQSDQQVSPKVYRHGS